MGRSAGWLAYGAAIAGEASLVISVEDITGKYEQSEEMTDPKTGKNHASPRYGHAEVVNRIVATMRAPRRGRKQGIRRESWLAEGLAEFLPNKHIEGVPRDEQRPHRHLEAKSQPFVFRA